MGDQRNNRKAVMMGTQMAQHPEWSLPRQMKNWSTLMGAYRLLNHPKVTMEALLTPHWEQTKQAARQHPVVLWVEDTSELDYSAHRDTTGLGPIGNGQGQGFLLHSTLGVIPETRQVLGLGYVQVVLREPRVKRAAWNRSAEALMWRESAQTIGPAPESVQWVHVSDSGSDDYDYVATCRKLDKDFLIRVYHNRLLTWPPESPQAAQKTARKLLDYVRSLPPAAGSAYLVSVEATATQPAREASLVVAWAPVQLAAPKNAPAAIRQHPPLSLWVVRAWEPQPPSGAEAVEWILLTSLAVKELSEAQRVIRWYTHRWLCEDFHQCLKTGCRVEASQLDDGADLQKLLGFLAPIAARLLQIRQETRQAPEGLALQVADPLEVKLLARQFHHDPQTMTVAQFWQGVAQLGGYLARKQDGPPGWRSLWHGWQYLSDLALGARLAAEDP